MVQPIPKTIEIYRKKRKLYEEQVQELKKYINKDTVTQDEKRVCLAANIGNAEDAVKAVESGAECVGLFRTEFLFMNGVSMPTEEEQFEVYKRAAVICKDKVLTIRTLDIGGDKDKGEQSVFRIPCHPVLPWQNRRLYNTAAGNPAGKCLRQYPHYASVNYRCE